MLLDRYRRDGTPVVEAFGTEYPGLFLSPAVEYAALVRSCGVIDLAHRRVFVARGDGRAALLDRVLTNDVESLEPGKGRRALLVTEEGTIVSLLAVFARKTDHVVVVEQGDFEETLVALESEASRTGVSLEDLSETHDLLAVEGPEARRVVERLLGAGILPPSSLGIVERPFETFGLLVMTSSASGEHGFHVLVPAEETERIRDYLVQAARGSDGVPVGLAAWNARRLEAGIPWYGVDFGKEHFPHEARLSQAVYLGRRDFRGRRALARSDERRSPGRVLAGFVADDERIPDAPEIRERLDVRGIIVNGSPIYRRRDTACSDELDSETVGFVTSAAYSPALAKPLVLARVDVGKLDDRFPLAVRTPHGSLCLRPIELPLAFRVSE